MTKKYLIDESVLKELGLDEDALLRLSKNVVIKAVTVKDIIDDLIAHDVSMKRAQSHRCAWIEQKDLVKLNKNTMDKLKNCFDIVWDYKELELSLCYPYSSMKVERAREEAEMRKVCGEWLSFYRER